MNKNRDTVHKLIIPTPYPIGPVNVYLVKSDALCLIDTGPKTEAAWESLKYQLKELGYGPSDIEQVVLTHHHTDHVGLLDFLKKANEELAIVGHWRNQPWIGQDSMFLDYYHDYFQRLYMRMGVSGGHLNKMREFIRTIKRHSCRVDLSHTIKEGDTVPGVPGWIVMETPGHAQSHIVLYREQDGVVIGGDHIIQKVPSNSIMEAPYSPEGERPKTLMQYRESLLKLKGIEVSLVLSGHRDDITNIDETIDLCIQKQDERAAIIKNMIGSEPLTCYEICQKLFPEKYESQFILTMSETLGHLDLLEMRGEVKETISGGISRFQANS